MSELNTVTSKNTLAVAIDFSAKMNYALQQNDVPVVREITVQNCTEEYISDLVVTLRTASDFTKPWEARLGRLAPGETRRLFKIDLQFDSAKLSNLLERVKTEIDLTVTQDGRSLWSSSYQLEVLAFNEWPGLSILPEIIAAFVCPNHPAVATMLNAVRRYLETWTGDGSLNGYQSASSDRCFKMLAGVYHSMQDLAIGYINPPASFEQEGQKIRTPDQIFEASKSGTCLDLTVAAAALLEQMGLHPLLLLTKGHAFVGVWLKDTPFSDPTIDDGARISNRVGLHEIGVFETTSLCDGKAIPFEKSIDLARRHFENPDEFVACVDIRAARRSRILPLPPRIQVGNGFVVVELKPSEDAQKSDRASIPTLEDNDHPRNTADEKATRRRVADLPEDALKRLELWKRKLLDLSLRNPLLNFRSKSRAVQLLVPDIALLEDRLAAGQIFSVTSKSDVLVGDGPRDLDLESMRTGRDIPTEVLKEEFERGLLRADAIEAFLPKMIELFRSTRTNIEETGSNTLFLALGTLKWYETSKSEEARYSPLLLVPVKLERPTPNHFKLQVIDEEARVNVTLLEKLRLDFHLKASHLANLEDDESGVNVAAMLHGFRNVIKDMPRWEVRETTFLGNFSFAKFLLWADLDQRLEQIAKNPIVKFILTRSAEGREFSDFPTEQSVHSLKPADVSLCPLDADSSQQAAIEAAMNGKTFVLQGPPGTGKSQTITNLIARAAASGKRVLFVAEKLAALSVVRSRLQKIGLGQFVLELHSSKGGKKEVIDQLKVSLESTEPTGQYDWNDEVTRLADMRGRLNSYVQAMHKTRESGESVFAVVSRVATLVEAPNVESKFTAVGGMTAAHLRNLRSAVDDAAGAARAVGDVARHPLRGVRLKQWRLDIGEKARGALESALQALSVFRSATINWLGILGVPEPIALQIRSGEIAPLYNLTRLLIQRTQARPVFFSLLDWEPFCKAVPSIVLLGQERDALLAKLAETYTSAFFTLDHKVWNERIQHAASKNVAVRWLVRRRILREANAFVLPGHVLSIARLTTDLSAGMRFVSLKDQLIRSDPLAGSSEPTIVEAATNWTELESEAKWAQDVHLHIQKAAAGAGSIFSVSKLCAAVASLLSPSRLTMKQDAAERTAADLFIEATKILQAAIKQVEQLLQASAGEMTGHKQVPVITAFEQTVRRWLSAVDELPDWAAWQTCLQRTDVDEIRPIQDAIAEGKLEPSKARSAFEATYSKAWLNSVLMDEPALRSFTHESRSRLVAEFRAADRRVMRLSHDEIGKSLAAARPSMNLGSANANSELGILRRQIQLQRNHKPVRRLIKELPTILPKLKPIWLMSPLSVAQYLDPATPPFDLVVFDEASQIPVWDAVGAMARGAKAVIVGDSKQLPPTNFFQRQELGPQDLDDGDVEEMESILDECLAASIPELKLRWHYRSRHESLIAFSNQQYYDNNLLTFPSADLSHPRLGVSLRYLRDARYDRGGSRTNQIEAKAIVDEIVSRLEFGERSSFGVVTFSAAQQRLIEDLIDFELIAKPDLKKHFDAKDGEYIFVKNLENVQGDERDVIFFSICYGITPSGKPSFGFGPINRSGGERRLNVAITRAREQVVVFSSIKSEHINLSQSRSRGLSDLKHFLDYAERGPKALQEMLTISGEDQFDSPFEQEVCSAIRGRGWSVDTQVGCSGYRIDMAIRDPERPGRYLLGIECDGASYHSAATARDRDRLREEVLRGLGWTLHRVWSTDWIQNREKSLARILAAIDVAVTAAQAANPASPVGIASGIDEQPAAIVADRLNQDVDGLEVRATLTGDGAASVPDSRVGMMLPGAAPHRLHVWNSAYRQANAFYTAGSLDQLKDDAEALVYSEGPIHLKDFNLKIAGAWGLQKVTKRVESRLDLIRTLLRYTSEDEFIRFPGRVIGTDKFRIADSSSTRPLEFVSPEEHAAAILAILRHQGSLPSEDLEREVCRLFGFQRSSEAMRRHTRRVLDKLVAGGQIVSNEGMVRIAIL